MSSAEAEKLASTIKAEVLAQESKKRDRKEGSHRTRGIRELMGPFKCITTNGVLFGHQSGYTHLTHENT